MSEKYYPDPESNPNFAALEETVLGYWEKTRAFEASVTHRPAELDGAQNEYVFYDGPPFANGLPHYGHLLTGFVKDAYARYHTVRGQKVERRFGWDCHGLPAEMGAEKELGISGRAAITGYGIDKFNAHCQSSVMKYAHEWEDYVTRQGRWVDFKNDYKTMQRPYMESVLWAFKQLYDKGLIFESHRVMPYSWAAETPLSNFETKLDNSYRERTDKAVEVAFKAKNIEKLTDNPEALFQEKDVYLVAWTTTPWTLPSNLALAASDKLKYWATFSEARNRWEVRVASEENPVKLKDTFDNEEQKKWAPKLFYGNQLIGLEYEPLFPYFAGHENAFKVLDGSSFIEEGEGTGIVHMAPGFGEDDQRLCAEAGIELVVPVDESGRYTDEIFDLLNSERLYLRPFTEADYPRYQQLCTDPEVAASTSDGVLPEEKIRAEFDRYLRDQKEKGFTQWAVFRREDHAFIGRAGFDNRDFDQFNRKPGKVIELRYAFLSEYWNRGYATEASVALLDWAFATLKPDYITAGSILDYAVAVHMMTKLGFAVDQQVQFRNSPVNYNVLTPDAWQAHRASLPHPEPTTLSLKGLNVVAQTTGQCEAEPYTEAQLQKYGLANLRIINYLKLTGALIRQDDYKHNYPHCWRTDQPLIYRALPSWYVKVTAIRDRAVELNQQINWIPEHIRDGQMGHMLATAPDWSISRNRFWGTPIPVWRSDNPENDKLYVFGSIKELEDFFGQNVEDLHRPFIDNLTKPDPENPAYTLRRVSDVFDCWFESGSMPFAQVHYPFENKDWFESHFPADFITEYVGQTRGWFNTLIILATALFDKPPFKNCICHGVVLDSETGLKYSKRLKNYRDPREVIGQFGADALRWLMLASPVMRGSDISVDPQGAFIRDVVRLHIKPLWNAYNFFCLYANADGLCGKLVTTSPNLMDRYILAKLKDAVLAMQQALDAYDTSAATSAASEFFEVLNNWYIRRSRARFWKSAADEDKQAAYDTLYTVLHAMCRALSPLLPFTTEAVYLGLTGANPATADAGASVHLADWPDLTAIAEERELVADMDRVRDVCNAALSIRNAENIRIRQPLETLTYVGGTGAAMRKEFLPLVADEINVHRVESSEQFEETASFKVQVNLPLIGKKYGPQIKAIMAATRSGEWKQDGDRLEIGGVVLEGDEFTVQLQPKDGIPGKAQALSSNDALVILDTTITPELAQEGIARDLVRMIQEARKNAGLDISDRIALVLDAPESVQQAAIAHRDYISEQTLALDFTTGQPANDMQQFENTLEGNAVTIALKKAVMAA